MRNAIELEHGLQQADSRFQFKPMDVEQLSQAVVQRRQARRKRRKLAQASLATVTMLALAVTAWNPPSGYTNRFASQSPTEATRDEPSSNAWAAANREELRQQIDRLQDRVAVLESLVADYEQLALLQLKLQQEQFGVDVSEQAMQRKLERSKDLAITFPIDFGY